MGKRRVWQGLGEARKKPEHGDTWTHKETGKVYRWNAEKEMWAWTGAKKAFDSPMETRRHGLAPKSEET